LVCLCVCVCACMHVHVHVCTQVVYVSMCVYTWCMCVSIVSKIVDLTPKVHKHVASQTLSSQASLVMLPLENFIVPLA